VKKLLYVCLDGLGDDPIPKLDHRTPLEAAPTPALDALAARGRTGVVVTVGEGIAPESDIAVFAILGYDPREEHPGRGVVEAVGSDMVFRDGDLAYRVNFATCDWPAIVDRRVGRDLSSEESHALADEVNQKLSLPNASFTLAATVEHRGSLVIRADDGPLSAEVSNTDPAYRKEGSLGVALETFEPVVATCEPLNDTDAAHRAAELTNRFVREAAQILDVSEVNAERRRRGKLPGNLILTRDGGDHLPQLQDIRSRFGPDWGCFVEMPVERGIAKMLGMHAVAAPRLTIDAPPEVAVAQYAGWAGLAAEALGGYDALYVHIKGPDVPAHDGRAEDKRDVIAAIDAGFFSEIMRTIDPSSTIVAVTADHSTSCVRKAHTAEPVPLVVSGGGVTADGSQRFGERACASGSLGQMLGVAVLPLLARLAAD
jgi:2,3-bisphosphoglycerate-independent phosphoglycerate mutase